MSATVKTDKSEILTIKSRVNEDGMPITLIFVDENSDTVDISAKEWQIPVRRTEGSTTDLFLLEEGDGLTVGGAGDNELTIALTDANATLKAGVYFFRLFSVTENKTWLNGRWEFHNGLFGDVTNSATVTIDNGDQVVTINIGGGGGSSSTTLPFGTHDASGGTFPTVGTYNMFKVTVAGTIDGVYCGEGDLLIAMQTSPTSDWNALTGWKKF